MPAWILLLITMVLYGVWAVAMKVVGDNVSLPWAAAISLAVCVPVDLLFISRISGPPPSPRHVVWMVVLVLCSVLASLAYLRAARHFSGVTLTAVTAMYPIVALPVFALMGERPNPRQLIGVVLCALGAWFIS